MQEKLLKEIEGMEYPSGAVDRTLEEEGITDRYMAAAYGFGVAKGMAQGGACRPEYGRKEDQGNPVDEF